MVTDTRSDGRPPAARSAVSRLPRAHSNCSTTPEPTICPWGFCAVWPARKARRPAGTDTTCEKPDGLPSPAGLIRSMATVLRITRHPGKATTAYVVLLTVVLLTT